MAESLSERAKRSTTRFIEISTSRPYYRCYRAPPPHPFLLKCARMRQDEILREKESEGEREVKVETRDAVADE